MELDQKLRYAVFALTAASLILAGLGFHAGAHLRVLDGGNGAD
jgi:hypothetical protein